MSYFAGQSNVLDVGCGRGEFLDLLKQQGISSKGLDLNPEMVEVCRSRGLDATAADARSYLQGLPDESLGGLIAVQVIEHLEPAYLTQMLGLAFDKVRPGGRVVLETINPACWVAFFESFIRDLTHVKPIHPETLQYLLQASGFSNVEIVYRAPIAPEGRLQKVTARPDHFGDTAPDALTELVSSFNQQRRSAERPDVFVPGLRRNRDAFISTLRTLRTCTHLVRTLESAAADPASDRARTGP